MKQRLVQIGIPVVCILACAVLVPPMMVMPIILLVMSTLFCGGLKWHWVNLSIALVIALTAAVIASMVIVSQFISDYSVFAPHNLKIIAYWGMLMALPWLLGLGLGSLWLMKRPQPDSG